MLKQKFQSLLRTMIVEQIGVNKSIARFFTSAVEAVLTHASVAHKVLAQALLGDSLVESSIRRTERFFANPKVNLSCFSYVIWEALKTREKVTLVIDRTTWCYGKKPINLLVVAIIWRGSAIPVIWEVLPKKGGSSIAERKRIMGRVTSVIGIENIEVVLADREFIGYEWFKFLHEKGIPFIIRIKNASHAIYDCGARTSAETIMRIAIPAGRMKADVSIYGAPVKIVGTRSVNGELVIVAASREIPQDALDAYAARWLIELCFRSLKRKGFNMEETHMTDPDRINKLFAIVAIACLLAVIAGGMRAVLREIPKKNHGRPEYSVFMYGLDLVKAIFTNRRLSGFTPPDILKILHAVFDQENRRNFVLEAKSIER